MHNELTQKDLQLMREELDYRRVQLRPKLLEAVKEARAFGGLSENFEYKAAKQEKNKNETIDKLPARVCPDAEHAPQCFCGRGLSGKRTGTHSN